MHITEVEDEAAATSVINPLERLKPGDSIKAAVLGMVPTKYVSPAHPLLLHHDRLKNAFPGVFL